MNTINSPMNKPTETEISEDSLTILNKNEKINITFSEIKEVIIKPLYWYPFWYRYAIVVVTIRGNEFYLSSYKRRQLEYFTINFKDKNIPIKKEFFSFMPTIGNLIPLKSFAFSKRTSLILTISLVIISLILIGLAYWWYSSEISFPNLNNNLLSYFIFAIILLYVGLRVFLTFKK